MAAWNDKVTTLHELGRYQKAIKVYERALQFDPNEMIAWNNMKFALRKLGRNQEAIKAYERALQLYPDDTKVWYNKGGVAWTSWGDMMSGLFRGFPAILRIS